MGNIAYCDSHYVKERSVIASHTLKIYR